jgi:hypothetical protein
VNEQTADYVFRLQHAFNRAMQAAVALDGLIGETTLKIRTCLTQCADDLGALIEEVHIDRSEP